MSSIEQLETLRNAELYDDCKTLVIYKENFFFISKNSINDIIDFFSRQNLF
jgi:hypothetical protein